MFTFAFKTSIYALDEVKIGERFADFAVRTILDNLRFDYQEDGPLNLLADQYCSLSGAVYGRTSDSELAIQVRVAVQELGHSSLISVMEEPRHSQLVDALESIVDHIYVRNLVKCRPAPSLVSMNDRLSIQHYPAERQLAILVNLFLTPREWNGVESQVERFEKAIQRAADIDMSRDDCNEALNALIELDAKYNIVKLLTTRKEKARLTELNDAEVTDFAAVARFAVSMITYRDVHGELDVATRWTTKAYHASTFNQAQRPERSNLLKPAEKAKATRKYTKRATPKAAVKSRDAKKQAVHNAFASLNLNIKMGE